RQLGMESIVVLDMKVVVDRLEIIPSFGTGDIKRLSVRRVVFSRVRTRIHSAEILDKGCKTVEGVDAAALEQVAEGLANQVQVQSEFEIVQASQEREVIRNLQWLFVRKG